MTIERLRFRNKLALVFRRVSVNNDGFFLSRQSLNYDFRKFLDTGSNFISSFWLYI